MKSEPLAQLFDEYLKRIRAYLTVETVMVKASAADRHPSTDHAALEETDRLLQKLDPRDWVVALDERGAAMRSEALGEKLREWIDRSPPRLVFVIGGPYGLGPKLKSRANAVLAVSQLTLPHELAAVVAAEQVYRAFTLLRNHPYHNGEPVQ